MMRQSSSRNQRSKGWFKLRHFLQICLLLAICTWLVYQVKHSRDKKRAFEGRKVVEEQPLLFRFGRKDVPVVRESWSETHSIDEVEAEEREEEEPEHGMRNEDVQDEDGRGGGVDDWIDEQDQYQDRRSEEKEQGEFGIEEENENLVEGGGSGDSLEHENSAVGASEENYKRDDASHSITHEIHLTAVETGNADAKALDEKNNGKLDADLKGNSSNESLVVSNFDDVLTVRDFTGPMTNLSSISLGENSILHEAANHSINRTSKEKNLSDLGDLNQKELQTNNTATSDNSTVVDSVL